MSVRVVASLAVSALFLVSACGGNDAAPTTTTAPPTTTLTTETTTATTTTTTGTMTTTAGTPGVYENASYGFRMSYPLDWTVEEDTFDTIVMFLSPLRPGDEFAENVNIVAESLGGMALSLTEYVEVSVEVLEGVIPGFTLIDEGPDEVDGLPAHTLVFSDGEEDGGLLWVQSMVLHDGWAFIFTYTAGEDFDLFFDDALAIFESWEFTR